MPAFEGFRAGVRGRYKGSMAPGCSEPQAGLPVGRKRRVKWGSAQRGAWWGMGSERRSERQCWPTGNANGNANGLGWRGLDESELLTSRKHQTHFLEKTLPGELPPGSWGLLPTLRFSGCSKSYSRPAEAALLQPLLSPREPSPTPSGRPVTSTHAAQGADSGHGIQ